MVRNRPNKNLALFTETLGGGAFFSNPTSNAVASIEGIYRRRLREMCVNRFKWEGLPDTIDARFVESVLYDQGLIIYCRPERFNPTYPNGEPLLGAGKAHDMMLRGTPSGWLDYQDNPMAYQITANTLFTGILDVDECVPVWSNSSRRPDHEIVRWYSRRLAEAERTIDINLKSARHTRMLTVPEEQRMTAVNVLRKVDEGEHAIMGGEHLDMGMFNTLDMGMDYHILETVPVSKNQIMNDCMTMLGLNNANQDKTERLISGEVDARSEQVGANRAIALKERQAGAKRINKMFGTNIIVSWDEEIARKIDQENEVRNGNVHDGTEESITTNP